MARQVDIGGDQEHGLGTVGLRAGLSRRVESYPPF